MDTLNRRLVQLLEKDARQSSESLAKQLKISSATVRRRIRSLLQDGVIRIAAVTNPSQLGLTLVAIIGFDVDHDKLEQVMETLAGRDEITWLSTTTGRFDIIALARFASPDGLYTFVQKEMGNIEGLRDSETFICLHLKKASFL